MFLNLINLNRGDRSKWHTASITAHDDRYMPGLIRFRLFTIILDNECRKFKTLNSTFLTDFKFCNVKKCPKVIFAHFRDFLFSRSGPGIFYPDRSQKRAFLFIFQMTACRIRLNTPFYSTSTKCKKYALGQMIHFAG